MPKHPLHLEQSIIRTQRTRNTDDLFAHFTTGRERAMSWPAGVVRNAKVKAAFDAEWHGLFTCLLVEAIQPLYDQERIAKRLDEMRGRLIRRANGEEISLEDPTLPAAEKPAIRVPINSKLPKVSEHEEFLRLAIDHLRASKDAVGGRYFGTTARGRCTSGETLEECLDSLAFIMNRQRADLVTSDSTNGEWYVYADKLTEESDNANRQEWLAVIKLSLPGELKPLR